MRVVKDFEISDAERQSLMLPLGSRILGVNASNDRIYISVLGNPEAELVRSVFRVFKSGEVFDESKEKYDYLGSAVIPKGTRHLVRVV